MKQFATLRNARLLQVLGLVIAIVGLSGFWLGRDVSRAQLTQQQRDLLGIEADDFHASFVVAGRDVFYSGEGTSTPVYGAGGRIVAWNYQGVKHYAGIQTDTIMYVSIVNDVVTLIAIPRDLFVGDGTSRINGVFYREGPDGLARRVESILGLPIDYHAIIDIDIFQNLVDALGGVEVYVPERMYYRDNAANLTIDLQEGLQVLDGEQDIFGRTVDTSATEPTSEVAPEAFGTSEWGGGSWTGSPAMGATWAGATWAGATWAGATWAGATWAGATWAGATWTGSDWEGATWAGATWAGATWANDLWSSAGWE